MPNLFVDSAKKIISSYTNPSNIEFTKQAINLNPQKLNKVRKIALVVVTLTLFLLLVLYLIQNQDRIAMLMNVNKLILIYLFVCSLFATFTIAFGFRNLMILFKMPIKTREWIGLSVTNSMYNYIVPFQGAMLIRAKYLKAKYGFEYSKYAALSGGALLIGLLTASLASIILLLLKNVLTGFFYKNLFILVCILFSITMALSAFLWFTDLKRIKTGWLWLDNLLSVFFSGIDFFKKNNSLLLVITATNIFLYFFIGLRLYFSFKAIGVPAGLLEIVVIQAISAFSMVLPITPGNLGVREGIIGLTSLMLNIRIEDAILAAALDRAVGMFIIFILGSLYHFILMKELKLKV